MLVLSCHIPYIFFSGKESLLIMVDEIRRRSASALLDYQIQQSVTVQVCASTDDLNLTKDEPNKSAHKNIEPWIYYSLTLGLYGITLTGACFIQSISVIFGFVSAFALSSIVYTLPGCFYLMTHKKYVAIENQNRFRMRMSVVYIVVGLALFVFLTVSEVLQIIFEA